MKKTRLFIVGFICLVLIVVVFSRVRGKSKTSSFEVEEAKLSELLVTVSASGVVSAQKDETVTFQTGGMLSWVGVKENDTVKKWQAIASLDKKDLQKRLEKQMNNYLTNRWDFEQTQDNYEETKERKLVTDAIQRILDKTQFSLNNAVLDVELADVALKFSTIYSPFDGIVVSANPGYPGVNVIPSSAGYRIIDPQSVYFKTQVDETDVVKIKEGNKAIITLDAYPNEEIQGEVKKIDFISTLTSGGGTAYNVFVSLPADQKFAYRLGMNGDAQIVADSIPEAMTIPLSAIFEKSGKTYLWKIVDGKAKQTEIKIGSTTENDAQVLFGLALGDKFLAQNSSGIKEGLKIKSTNEK